MLLLALVHLLHDDGTTLFRTTVAVATGVTLAVITLLMSSASFAMLLKLLQRGRLELHD